jgi:branched-chain amino acid transport system permease protein
LIGGTEERSLFSFQLLVAALATGSIYALIAVGLNLIYGTMRLLNLAHGDLVMLGAYAAYWGFSGLHIDPLVAIPFIGLLAAGIGAAAYLFLFQRFLRDGARSDRIEANSLLAFFGLSIAIENLASIAFTGNTRAYQYLDQVVHIGSASILGNRLAALSIALATCAAVLLFFRFTTLGLAVRAIIQSRDAAEIVGVNARKAYLLSFCIGFGLAGVTGALVSLYSQIWPFMGFSYTVAGFVIIILGGLGNIYGSVIGGLLLGVLETFGVAIAGANYRSILIYGVFIAILVLRPQGLLGAKSTAR